MRRTFASMRHISIHQNGVQNRQSRSGHILGIFPHLPLFFSDSLSIYTHVTFFYHVCLIFDFDLILISFLFSFSLIVDSHHNI